MASGRVKARACALVLCLAMVWPGLLQADDDPLPRSPEWASESDAMVSRALIGTLYKKKKKWLPRFRQRIADLEGQPATVEARLELMKFHFYLAGLLAELSHVLSFTSKFKVQSVRDDFDRHSRRSKELAEEILEREGLTREQKAEAYFFFGASEGYVGIVEYGAGDLLSALINGLSADNHLEDALQLNPRNSDAYVGLGVYEYGNTRIGGVTNFLMQGGRDLRLEGIRRIEKALEGNIVSRPLALKTLIWFYISEEINPQNASAESGDPLSPTVCRRRALELLQEYEARYFRENAPEGFVGNKGLAMMKAIQFVLDRNYAEARKQFERVLRVSEYLEKEKGYAINPKVSETVKEGIRFCDLMVSSVKAGQEDTKQVCPRIRKQIDFIESGGSMVEYESKKIRGEIQNVFHQRLKEMHHDRRC